MCNPDHFGGTSRQAETCILCGGGYKQLLCTRLEEPGSTYDLWICPPCWDKIRDKPRVRSGTNATSHPGGTSRQAETCILCGGGCRQQECTKAKECGDPYDHWICQRCWGEIGVDMELRKIEVQWRQWTRRDGR